MSEGVLLYAVNKDTGFVHPVNVDLDGKIKLAPSTTLLGVVDGHIMGYDGTTWRNILVDATGKIILGPGSSNIGDVDVLTLPALPAGNNNIGDVDIASIAAGNNNIGNVDVLSLPSLIAGDANIGNVDVLSIAAGNNNIGNVDIASAIPAGTNNIGDVDILSIAAGANRIGSVGSEGWVSGAWKKNPILDGVSGPIRIQVTNTAMPAGTSNQDATAVPAGEVWMMESIIATYTGTVANVGIYVICVSSAIMYFIDQFLGLTSGTYVSVMKTPIMFWPGETLRFRVTNATLNDDFNAYAIGRRMDIDQ